MAHRNAKADQLFLANEGGKLPTNAELIADINAGDIVEEYNDQNLIDFSFLDKGPTNAVSNARANRAAALKQLGVQRKRLEFQRSTGLRDIKQARAKGLEGAVNDALQRGIFRSGIRQENENTVNREADEEKSDLKTEIQISLDELAARREGVASQTFGDASTGGRVAPLSVAEADALAVKTAGERRQHILDSPEAPTADNLYEPSKAITQVPRQSNVVRS